MNCAMEVTLHAYPDITQYGYDEIEQTFVLAADDTFAFCKTLLSDTMRTGYGYLPRCSLSFDVNVIVKEEAADSYYHRCRQVAPSSYERLLEPFRTLNSVLAPHISGPMDPEYKLEFLKSLCKQAPSHEGSFHKVTASLEQGAEAFRRSEYHLALSTFKAAIDDHGLVPTYYVDSETIIEHGVYAGLPLHEAAARLESILRLNLSETYLQLEHYEEAHDCSALALNAIGKYERDTERDYEGIPPTGFYALMSFASENLGMVRHATSEIFLAAEGEPGNKRFEAELKRLKKELRESGPLFLEPDDPAWKARENFMIEEGRSLLEDWKWPKREEKRVDYIGRVGDCQEAELDGERSDSVQYSDPNDSWQ